MTKEYSRSRRHSSIEKNLESHIRAANKSSQRNRSHNEGLLGHCIVLLLGLRFRHHTCKAWHRQSISSTATANKCQPIPKKCNIKEFHYQADFPNEVSCFDNLQEWCRLGVCRAEPHRHMSHSPSWRHFCEIISQDN